MGDASVAQIFSPKPKLRSQVSWQINELQLMAIHVICYLENKILKLLLISFLQVWDFSHINNGDVWLYLYFCQSFLHILSMSRLQFFCPFVVCGGFLLNVWPQDRMLKFAFPVERVLSVFWNLSSHDRNSTVNLNTNPWGEHRKFQVTRSIMWFLCVSNIHLQVFSQIMVNAWNGNKRIGMGHIF